jgi:hypothetical protein
LAEGETKIESLKNLAFVYISEDEQKEALKTFKEALSLISDKSLNYYLISGNIAELEDDKLFVNIYICRFVNKAGPSAASVFK